MTHLPFNDFDLAAVTNIVTDAKSQGLKADYDLARKEHGIVTLEMENWFNKDGSFVIYEIHKISKKGFFGTTARWIVQLYKKDYIDAEPEKKGCNFAKVQVEAIRKASIDVEHGFLGVCDFDLAYQALME